MAGWTFRDKVAIVTGASSGIGRSTALALAREGAHVALAARRLHALEAVAQEVKSLGREASVVCCDVPQEDQVRDLVASTLDRWGRIDILIANAGQYIRSPITQLTMDRLEQSMAVNFYGNVNSVQAVLPHMLARREGHIILMNSMIALRPFPPDVPYTAAKFALRGYGETLRQELIGTGVYSTLVYPARVDTSLLDNLDMPWLAAKMHPETVAKAVLKAIQRRKHKIVVAPFQSMFLYYMDFLLPVSVSDRLANLFKLRGWESA